MSNFINLSNEIDFYQVLCKYSTISFFNLIENNNNTKFLCINPDFVKRLSFYISLVDLISYNFEGNIYLTSHINVLLADVIKSTQNSINNNDSNKYIDIYFIVKNNLNELNSIKTFFNNHVYRDNYLFCINIHLIFVPSINISSAYWVEKVNSDILSQSSVSVNLDKKKSFDNKNKSYFIKNSKNYSLLPVPIRSNVLSLESNNIYFKMFNFYEINKEENNLSNINSKITTLNIDTITNKTGNNCNNINEKKTNNIFENKYNELEELLLNQFIDFFKKIIFKVFNNFTFKFSKGNLSFKLRLKLEQIESSYNHSYNLINNNKHCLFLFDRNIDILSSLLSQLIFEGALHENLNYNISQTVEIEDNLQKKKIYVNSDKNLFETLRVYHVNEGGEKIKEIFNDFNKLKNICNNNTDNINNLKRIDLNYKDSVTKYINLKDNIKLFFEINKKMYINSQYVKIETDLICNNKNSKENFIKEFENIYNTDILQFLRLFIIYLITQSINLKNLNSSFHIEELLKIKSLYDKCDTNKNFDNIINYLNNISARNTLLDYEDYLNRLNLLKNKFNKSSIYYSYNGYAPLFSLLVKKAIKNGWGYSKKSSLTQNISNKSINELKIIEGDLFACKNEALFKDANGYVVIVIIGGITYSEIISLETLFKKKYCINKKLLIVTSDIINNNTMINLINN